MYSTQTDIQGEIGAAPLIELTDDEGLGTVNAARVTAAIEQADAEINSFLAQRYTVPLTTGLVLLRDLSVTLSLERLYGRRPGSLPDDRKDRAIAARRLLRDIADGRAALGDVPAPAPPPAAAGPAEISSAERVFSRDTMGGF